jgi:rhodanese-related sulfurtransferase
MDLIFDFIAHHWLVVTALVALGYLYIRDEKCSVEKISIPFAVRLINAGVLPLDARTKAEFSKSHILGALELSAQPRDGNQDIIIYDDQGETCDKIDEFAKEYEGKIYFLHGGIKAWIDCGYPLISTNEEDMV